ncbi:hypothetical protein [Rhodococcus sp. HNM0569]|uniref:hypothetical protein n=1 Tax=Rhodococcus sp. HNM0569 TaxID=2716340 RepID=UPI00146A3028|nr:hypothetical protein [Rhodococcus sp. HNM0569]NLU83434.1 hypothetical protein [Rhodococcus sp. HNM0569]
MGADIGSNLLYLSATAGADHPITDVLTNPIDTDDGRTLVGNSLQELVARLVLSNPQLIGRVVTDPSKSTIQIDSAIFRIHFQAFEDDLEQLGHFDLAILATSRRHVRSQEHLARLEAIADIVVGVAENANLPALYPSLLTADPKHFQLARATTERLPTGSYAMGSCQCVGWTTGLRVLADYCSSRGMPVTDVLVHSEVDIVHPDTASSSFGTKRVGSRTEDARDNLRPGTSQVADSMGRFAPATSYNAVSLRVLTQPPGYQVQRFFVRHPDVDRAGIEQAARALADREPALLHVSDSPIGSRAYSSLHTSTVLVATKHHMRVQQLGDISEVVLQGFVHNTRGYCAAILDAIDRVLGGDNVTVIDSHLNGGS